MWLHSTFFSVSLVFMVNRAKWLGQVHSDEHAVQIKGEPQVGRAQRWGQDPKDRRDQVHQSRWVIACLLPPHPWTGSVCIKTHSHLETNQSTSHARFRCADIEEKGVRMKLTVIDTPGFGDQINNENWWGLTDCKIVSSSVCRLICKMQITHGKRRVQW